MYAYLIFCFIVIKTIAAQIPFFTPCPDVKVVQNFDVQRYTGKWYEIEKYFTIFEFGGKCVTAEYTIGNDGVNVLNQQISTFTGQPSSIEGKATQTSETNEAKLSVEFPSLPVKFNAPYWVLGTDYDNYSVVWSCYDFGLINTRFLWVITRTRNPSPQILEEVNKIMEEQNISKTYLTKTDQSNCS